MHKAFTQHEYQVRYKIIAKLKKVKQKTKKNQNMRAACDPLGTSEILS